jgi:tetratricopeptide (TPR) repeat protein
MIRALLLPIVAIPLVAATATAQRADSSTRLAATATMADTMTPTITPALATEPGSGAAAVPDSVFLRAQRMVAQGQADSGRALVQAQLDAAPVGSPAYVKALYWRAAVAPTAAAAERDLRTIVIEYPLAPESADALLRLAQLEMARGDRQLALEHLDRLLLEHPDNPSAGRAGFWMGRLLFESQRPAAACARLAQAERATDPSDVELLNQIGYYEQRCVGVDTSRVHADTAGEPQPVAASRTARTNRSARTTHDSRTTHDTTHDTTADRGRFTVQIAAYNTKSLAEKLRAGLASKGLDAHVDVGGRYYRVTVGRYATRREAVDAAAKLRTQHIDGFVTAVKRP